MNQHYYQSKRMVLIPIVLFVLLLSTSISYAQGRGVITGTVTDSSTTEALFGTNVWLENTSLGVATGIEGEYRIPQIPAGTYTVIFRYIGYQQKRIPITIRDGQTIQLNVKLVSQALEGQEVVVTAQARGQKEAINQQLSSPTIVNIVSAEKIRQLPDDNAAAAVSRLPGITTSGDQIVIRGVEAKYNQIMVNGIPMPSTEMGTRASGIGFISSNMLSGIEVIKAITPDMDANTLGGVVNLRLATAQPGFHADAMAQGNYNIANRNADNYRFWLSLSNRFFDDQLGVFIQGNTDRSHGGGQSASISVSDAGYGEPLGQRTFRTTSASFNFGENITINSGGSVVLDYKLPRGKILLQGNYAGTVNENMGASWGFNTDASAYNIGNSHNKIGKDVWISSFQIDYNIGDLRLEGTASYSYTDQYTIVDYSNPFVNASKLIAPFGLDANGKIINYDANASMNIDLKKAYSIFDNLRKAEVDSATLEGWVTASNNTFRQHLTTFSVDATMPVNLTSDITAIFKGGWKLVRSYRFNDRDGMHTLPNEEDTYATVKNYFPDRPRNGGNRLRFTDVMDKDYYNRRGQYFLKSEYDFKQGLFANVDRDVFDDWLYTSMRGWAPLYKFSDSVSEDFTGSETFNAGYLMATLKLTSALTVIGGARYESYNMNYGAQYTYITHTVQGDGISTKVGTISAPWDVNNVNRTDINWFPNAQIKYKVTDWADIRVAYTTGITRPDYQNIIPKTVQTPNVSFVMGNPKVKPSTAQNIDVILSVYNNEIGLLTIGGFYKEIKDRQHPTTVYYANLKRYGDIWFPDSSFFVSRGFALPRQGDPITMTTNNPNKGYIRGIEIDWQTHFWYLPEPFNTLVLSANYTKSGSNMAYWQQKNTPVTIRDPITGRPKGTEYRTIDTVYTAKLTGQAEDVVNISLGVDYKDFSGRISLNMRGNISGNAPMYEDEYSYSGNIYRWDLTLKQNLPIKGLSIALNGTNIFNNPTYNYRRFKRNPTAPVTENLMSVSYNSSYIQLNLRYSL